MELLMHPSVIHFLSMQMVMDHLVGPMDWFLGLEGWKMAVVAIGSILGFYIVFRIIFKLVEALASLFN
jgi:hypothetical protein